MNNKMSLDTAKRLTTVFLVGCLLCCLAALLLPASDAVRMLFSWGAIALAVLGGASLLLFCRCPFCGAHLIRNLYKLKACPVCRRDFVTGVKKKGSGGKRPRR